MFYDRVVCAGSLFTIGNSELNILCHLLSSLIQGCLNAIKNRLQLVISWFKNFIVRTKLESINEMLDTFMLFSQRPIFSKWWLYNVWSRLPPHLHFCPNQVDFILKQLTFFQPPASSFAWPAVSSVMKGKRSSSGIGRKVILRQLLLAMKVLSGSVESVGSFLPSLSSTGNIRYDE